MDHNMGKFDRTARILAAAPLAYIGWKAGRTHHTKTRAIAWAAAGEVLASSVSGYSPFYAAIGFSTDHPKPDEVSFPS